MVYSPLGCGGADGNAGDDFDLDQHVTRQARHLHGRTRRLVAAETALIHRVELREIVEILDEDGALDHLGERGPGRGQYSSQVGENLFRLAGDIAADQLASRVERNLPRGE
jgi:hypothetical protein